MPKRQQAAADNVADGRWQAAAAGKILRLRRRARQPTILSVFLAGNSVAKVLAILAAVAVLAHSVVGCCWHHTHSACAHHASLAAHDSDDGEHKHALCNHEHGAHESCEHEHVDRGVSCPSGAPGKHSCDEGRCWMMASGGGQGPAYRLASLPLVCGSLVKISLLATSAERQALVAPHADGSRPTLVALHQILLV